MHTETRDPRLNAPPRLSDLQGDERMEALYARNEARRVAYMRAFRQTAAPGVPEHRVPTWAYFVAVLAVEMAAIVAWTMLFFR